MGCGGACHLLHITALGYSGVLLLPGKQSFLLCMDILMQPKQHAATSGLASSLYTSLRTCKTSQGSICCDTEGVADLGGTVYRVGAPSVSKRYLGIYVLI